MMKLLRAGFRRAFKSIIFWFGLCASLLMGVVSAINTRTCQYLDDVYIMPFFVIIAIVIALIIGTEHSDGSFRNKITAGHSKGSIYFANLIVFLAFALVAALLYLGIFALLMIGRISTFPTYALIVSAVGFVLVTLSYTVILVSVSMMISQRAINAVVCILLVLATVFSIYVIDDMLGHSEFIEITTIINGEEHAIREPNPKYIGGTPRTVLQNIEMLIPYGAVIEYSENVDPCFADYNLTLSLPAERVEQLKIMPIYSTIISVVVGLLGWALFRKKELK